MISLSRLRQLEPKLKHASDQDVALIRAKLYELGHIAMDSYQEHHDSKFPVGSTNLDDTK
jgi:hypothetical protein